MTQAVYLMPTARQLAAQKRFRCNKCSIFMKKPSDVPPGKDRIVYCTRGHSVIYHEPVTYYVQAFRDPVTHIIGDDANSGLSAMEPLITITEALKRCKSSDRVILPHKEEEEVRDVPNKRS